MSQPSTNRQRTNQEIYIYTLDLMRKGFSRHQIVRQLEKKGMATEDMDTLIERATVAYAVENKDERSADRDAAFQKMIMGAGMCLIGILITAVTFSAASEGGLYVVASGAILGGGVRFLQGFNDYRS